MSENVNKLDIGRVEWVKPGIDDPRPSDRAMLISKEDIESCICESDQELDRLRQAAELLRTILSQLENVHSVTPEDGKLAELEELLTYDRSNTAQSGSNKYSFRVARVIAKAMILLRLHADDIWIYEKKTEVNIVDLLTKRFMEHEHRIPNRLYSPQAASGIFCAAWDVMIDCFLGGSGVHFNFLGIPKDIVFRIAVGCGLNRNVCCVAIDCQSELIQEYIKGKNRPEWICDEESFSKVREQLDTLYGRIFRALEEQRISGFESVPMRRFQTFALQNYIRPLVSRDPEVLQKGYWRVNEF